MTTLMLRRKISSPGLRPSGQKQHRGWRLWLRAYRRLDHCVMENVAITRLAVHCTHNGPKGNHRHVVHQYERCSPAPKYCVCLKQNQTTAYMYCTVQTIGRTTKIFAPPPPPPRERGDEAPEVEDYYFPDSGGILSATRVYMAYKPMEQLKLIIVMRDQEQNGRIQSLPLKWDPDGKKPKQIQVWDWYLILSCDSYEIF